MRFNWYLIKRWFRFKYQILTRGFSDEDTWSLDCAIARFVVPRLKRFKELNNGFPGDLTEEKWDAMLDDMIYAMEVSSDVNVEGEVDWARVTRGLEYFGKYFRDLWW